MPISPRLFVALAALILALSPARAQPLTTAFTYQGELKNGAALASGNHDLRFRLYDAATGGNQVGTQLCLDNVAVASGRFTVTLDFGAQFAGLRRWLEIDARQDTGLDCSNATGFTLLTPRQELTATPYSLSALNDVQLQPALPGFTQTGNVNISGAGFFGGSVGIGTTTPGKKLTVAGDMEIGVNSADYHHFRIGGGNSNGFLYGSFPLLGDGIHMGYNWYADAAGVGHVFNAGGQTSRLSLGYGSLVVATGGVNQAPATRFSIDPLGNTAFSTAFPQQMTFAYDGTLTVPTVAVRGGGAGEANIQMYNANSQEYIYLGDQGGFYTRPIMGVLNPAVANTLRAGFKCDTSNQGVVFGDSKQFRVENPRLPGTDIAYACIEGPEVAAYVRGTAHLVSGRATIQLPQHFQDVAVSEGMTVQLTPCSAQSLGLAATFQATDHIEVAELQSGTGSYDFHWRVEAVRKGYEHFEVIRPTAERMISAQPQQSTPDH